MKHATKKTERAPSSEPLPAEVVARVRKIVEERGEPGALEALGISRPTLGRALGRALGQLPLAAGSRALIANALREIGS